jgi:peroxiredoxin
MNPGKSSRLAAAATLVVALVQTGALADTASGLLGHELVRPADGSSVRLDAGATALHVVFTAVWCPPCLDELEELGQLEARWGERGYRLVLIPVKHRHTLERLESFRIQHDTPGELLFDQNGAVQEAAGVEGLPTHFVIDAQGREVIRSDSLDDRVRAAIESLMADDRSRGRR